MLFFVCFFSLRARVQLRALVSLQNAHVKRANSRSSARHPLRYSGHGPTARPEIGWGTMRNGVAAVQFLTSKMNALVLSISNVSARIQFKVRVPKWSCPPRLNVVDWTPYVKIRGCDAISSILMLCDRPLLSLLTFVCLLVPLFLQ
jgi:hypothetical protein